MHQQQMATGNDRVFELHADPSSESTVTLRENPLRQKDVVRIGCGAGFAGEFREQKPQLQQTTLFLSFSWLTEVRSPLRETALASTAKDDVHKDLELETSGFRKCFTGQNWNQQQQQQQPSRTCTKGELWTCPSFGDYTCNTQLLEELQHLFGIDENLNVASRKLPVLATAARKSQPAGSDQQDSSNN
ncbi:hypothetical protein SELMODRAFT_430303 [Selaginella moellendorffii]|uniref:Uncharacterized protein n=1 Tax=Selaginella moellendorffii TaxID=88036 RepID=D8T8Z4_SELML|nr:hypothetical protein SELMODRAFT_430303 [Selaginella moellendorffii]